MATKQKATRKPRQSTVPADETKAQKFVRLAEQRTKKAVVMLRNIGKLGSPGYERTKDQADKIAARLEKEVASLKTALQPGTKATKAEVDFKL